MQTQRIRTQVTELNRNTASPVLRNDYLTRSTLRDGLASHDEAIGASRKNGNQDVVYRKCTKGEPCGNRGIRRVIRKSFGKFGSQAVAVSKCESSGGGTNAGSKGSYYGLFQLSEAVRATYPAGNSKCAEGQCKAAWKYFKASGKSWAPWGCKPNSPNGC